MKNSTLVILAMFIYTVWLIGLTWGLLNLDYKINPPVIDYRDSIAHDTLIIHDTIYLSR